MSAVGSPPNTSTLKESKIPVPMSDGSARTTREDLLSSPVKKPPFESRKSAEALKLRLASAVSAKIANSKDGRSPNRGIGFLLQRKEQPENRLNTKDISFQKPVRNGGGKVETTDTTNANAKSVRNGMSKAELQKSLLSALLMKSRTPSGATSAQAKDTRLGTIGGKLNTSTMVKGKATNESNKKPLTTPNVAISGQNKDTIRRLTSSSQLNPSTTVKGKTTNESDVKILQATANLATSGQNTGTRLTTGIKLNPSSVKDKTSNEFKKKPLPNVTRENGVNKSQLDNANDDFGSGKVLDKAKNIETLLGLRKQDNSSVRATVAAKDAALNGKGKITEPKRGNAILNAEKNGDVKLDMMAIATKPVENGLKDGMGILNGKNNRGVSLGKFGSTTKPLENPSSLNTGLKSNGNSTLNKTATITQSVENVGKERNALNNSKTDRPSKTVSTSRPSEKVEKKSPPPVAKKPARTVFQTSSKQATMASGIDEQESAPKGKFGLDGHELPRNETTRVTTKDNSPQIRRKTPVLTIAEGNSPQIQRKAIASSKVNGTNLGNEAAFREDLLEKLEADVGSCKIAAFQSMEDFSVLRMKVYRVRGELDQLRRKREKRTPLLC